MPEKEVTYATAGALAGVLAWIARTFHVRLNLKVDKDELETHLIANEAAHTRIEDTAIRLEAKVDKLGGLEVKVDTIIEWLRPKGGL